MNPFLSLGSLAADIEQSIVGLSGDKRNEMKWKALNVIKVISGRDQLCNSLKVKVFEREVNFDDARRLDASP